MADKTTRIGLPFMATNQAQKETTYNEALEIMDFFSGPVVKSFIDTLPASPAEGDVYILTTVNADHANQIAHYTNGAWAYYKPFTYLRAINTADAIEYCYNGTSWTAYANEDAGARAEVAVEKANGFANDAKASATAAAKSAADASTSSTEAASSVTAATGKVTEASSYADSASESKTAASNSATAAANSATAAAQSVTDCQSVKESLSKVYTYKTTLDNYSDLPTSGQSIGDTYNIVNADPDHDIKAGDNVAWNGTAWDPLSGTVDLSAYAKNESPVFTGTPKAPTADSGTGTKQIATTEFVATEFATRIATLSEAKAGTDDAKIMTPLKVKAAVTNLINNQDNFAGASFDGVNSAGTKLGLAANWTWEKSTELAAGQDDYRKYKPFNQQRFLVKTDSNGVAQIVDWEGTSSFDSHLRDEDYGADPFVKFDLSYVRRYYDANGVDYRLISDRYLPGYHIPKMFLRGSSNTLYPWIGISARPFSKTTSGGLTTRSGHPIMYNKTENQFEALARAKGLFVAGQNEINYLQHLGTIKYCDYNWQSAVGPGVVSTYYSKDKACTVSQTSANSLIVSNANAALVSVGDYIGFNGSGGNQSDLPVTSIETYDANNKKIVVAGLSMTSVAGDTGFYRMCSWGGETDSILGLDGEITTGTAWKRSVLTLGIENLFGNCWKSLAGACRIGTDIWINPDPDASYTWPTDAANAATLGWIKLNGAVSTTEGYIKTFINDSSWPLTNYCATVGGNSAGPVGDYCHISTNMSSVIIVLFGGYLSNGSTAGPFCCNLSYGVGTAYWLFGALGVYRPAL